MSSEAGTSMCCGNDRWGEMEMKWTYLEEVSLCISMATDFELKRNEPEANEVIANNSNCLY